MKIYLKTLDEKKIFEKSWKTDVKIVKKFEVKRIAKFKIENPSPPKSSIVKQNDEDNLNSKLVKMDISTFLRSFLVKHNRLEYENQLRIQFNRMYINSVNDLTTLPAHAWESMQQSQNLGPIITPLLKKDIEEIRIKNKSDKTKEKTNGEILADLHKIKRFLFYETKIKAKISDNNEKKLIDRVAYLSGKALQDGFNEQKNDPKFDGGPIMDQIQSYLNDNFAAPDLSELVKPSHGMILVIINLK